MDCFIYDIQSTSRKNEWVMYTDKGLVFISWVKKYGTNDEYDLVSLHDQTVAGKLITGVEISNDTFLLKLGSNKNLTYYDRRTKKVISDYISDLNEYTTEFVLVPEYNYKDFPYMVVRTNTSLKLVNLSLKKAFFLLDLGLY